MNDEAEDGGEASSRQLLFSSCSWVQSMKTPPARSATTPSLFDSARTVIPVVLKSIVAAKMAEKILAFFNFIDNFSFFPSITTLHQHYYLLVFISGVYSFS